MRSGIEDEMQAGDITIKGKPYSDNPADATVTLSALNVTGWEDDSYLQVVSF